MIRKATLDDIDQIWKLHTDYIFDVNRVSESDYGTQVQSRGFIVADLTREDVLTRIQKSHIFNVYEEDGKVLGLIDINKEIYFPEEATNIVWLDSKLKEKYFRGDKSIALHYIAVDSCAKGKNIAKQLFGDALTQLAQKGYTDLFCIVTTGPLTNCPSIIWHTKQGFHRACVTLPIDLFGLKYYTSLLFHLSIAS